MSFWSEGNIFIKMEESQDGAFCFFLSGGEGGFPGFWLNLPGIQAQPHPPEWLPEPFREKLALPLASFTSITAPANEMAL